MTEAAVLAVAAAAVTAATAPLTARALARRGRLDVPNHRSSHRTPVPRGGGIPCALGVATGVAAAAVLGRAVPWGAVVAALALAAVGYIDDRRPAPPMIRLAAQLGIGALLGASLGGLSFALVGAVVVPVAVNAVNFMDGINGITGLTVVVIAAAACYAGAVGDSTALVTLGAVTGGAALGFLPWNVARPRLFLGDVGSYLFGGLVGAALLLTAADGAPLAPVLAGGGIYVADVAVALGRRAIRRAPLTQAHREHVYQRLVDAGLPHPPVAAVVAGASAVLVVTWALLPGAAAAVLSVAIVLAYLSAPRGLALARRPQGAR